MIFIFNVHANVWIHLSVFAILQMFVPLYMFIPTMKLCFSKLEPTLEEKKMCQGSTCFALRVDPYPEGKQTEKENSSVPAAT